MVIDNQLYFFDLFEIIYFIVGEVILNMEQTIDTLIEPHDASPTEIVIFKIISGSDCFLVQSGSATNAGVENFESAYCAGLNRK